MAIATFFAHGEGDFAGVVALNGWVPYFNEIVEGSPSDYQIIHRLRAYCQPTKYTNLLHAPPDGSIPFALNPYGIIRRFREGVFITPFFMCHTEDNDIVPFDWGNRACHLISGLEFETNFEEYPAQPNQPSHRIDQPRGIGDILYWILIRSHNTEACM